MKATSECPAILKVNKYQQNLFICCAMKTTYLQFCQRLHTTIFWLLYCCSKTVTKGKGICPSRLNLLVHIHSHIYLAFPEFSVMFAWVLS